MPDEIRAVFRKVDGPELAQVVKKNTEWISLTHGLLYYYGVLPPGQLEIMLGKFCGREPDLLELLTVIEHAGMYYGRIRFDYDWGFYDERVFNPAKVVQEQQARRSIDDYPLDWYSFHSIFNNH